MLISSRHISNRSVFWFLRFFCALVSRIGSRTGISLIRCWQKKNWCSFRMKNHHWFPTTMRIVRWEYNQVTPWFPSLFPSISLHIPSFLLPSPFLLFFLSFFLSFLLSFFPSFPLSLSLSLSLSLLSYLILSSFLPPSLPPHLPFFPKVFPSAVASSFIFLQVLSFNFTYQHIPTVLITASHNASLGKLVADYNSIAPWVEVSAASWTP